MYHCARGIDNRHVDNDQQVKSIGNEETFGADITDSRKVKKELLALATKVGSRLRNKKVQGRTITLKVKYHDFKVVSRSVTLARPTSDSRKLYHEVVGLLPKTLVGVKAVRLGGISVGNLAEESSPQQLNLFQAEDDSSKELNRAIDNINSRYGSHTIQPALLHEDD